MNLNIAVFRIACCIAEHGFIAVKP